jgi:hypothetical protein
MSLSKKNKHAITSTPRAYYIKVKTGVSNTAMWYAREFAIVSQLHPRRIFSSKAGAYPSGAPYTVSNLVRLRLKCLNTSHTFRKFYSKNLLNKMGVTLTKVCPYRVNYIPHHLVKNHLTDWHLVNSWDFGPITCQTNEWLGFVQLGFNEADLQVQFNTDYCHRGAR